MAQLKQVLSKWTPVLGCFLVFLYSWGPILAFGAFQQYYKETVLSNYTESNIAWIGTGSGFLLFVVGIFAGPLYDHGHLRWLLSGGSLCVVLGIMLNSLCSRYFEIFLTQCVVLGIGSGMLWIPCMSFIAARFDPNQRALAIGLVTSGSSIGGVIFPIMFRELQPSVGFGWAVRCCGFLALAAGFSALALIFQIKSTESPFVRHIIDTSAFKELHFMSLIMSGLFSTMGYYISLIYIPTFTAVHIGGQMPSGLPFYMLALSNGASTFSRIFAGIIASKAGSLQTYLVALSLCAILAFAWIAVHSTAGMIVWTILWGMASGLIVSLPGSIIPLFTPKPTMIGTRMGMGMFPCGLGMLVGGPIGGAIIGSPSSNSRWWPLQVLIGFSMLSALLLCVYPFIYLTRVRKRDDTK